MIIIKTCKKCDYFPNNCGYVKLIKKEEPDRAEEKFEHRHNCEDFRSTMR